MGTLLFVSNVSVDGWTEDADGRLDWAPGDDDVFRCITDLLRTTSVLLYGRRMYEAMSLWETDPSLAATSSDFRDFAEVWQAADKVVFSTTMTSAPTARTQLEPRFDAGAVEAMKASAERDLMIGGPQLAAEAFHHGLVDEVHLFVWPVLLGGRKPALPTHRRAELTLLDERRFDSGVVLLRYSSSVTPNTSGNDSARRTGTPPRS